MLVVWDSILGGSVGLLMTGRVEAVPRRGQSSTMDDEDSSPRSPWYPGTLSLVPGYPLPVPGYTPPGTLPGTTLVLPNVCSVTRKGPPAMGGPVLVAPAPPLATSTRSSNGLVSDWSSTRPLQHPVTQPRVTPVF